MRRGIIQPLIGLWIFLARGFAIAAEGGPSLPFVDDQIELAQVATPTPALPPLPPTSAPRTSPTTPSPPPPRGVAAPPARLAGRPAGFPGRARLFRTDTRPPASGETPGLTSLSRFAGGGVPLMLGDLAPMFGPAVVRAHGSSGNAALVPWSRGYKMADNQSPRPQDRAFIAFNYFDDLRQASGSDLRQVKVYREFFGLEKTFFEGQASVGLRMPLNTISARSSVPGQGGTSTGVGDLTAFFKGILWEDRTSGSLLSAGLAVTPPTGPSNFAGASFASSHLTTSLQPFVGFIANRGDWFVQGFSGANIPTDSRIVMMYYNDIGAGYFLYRAGEPDAFLSAVVPTLEVHVNTPLNHRATPAGPGTPYVVDLTFGSSFLLGSRAVLSAGVVTPVTGPRPYELETVALLNVFFGRRRRPPTPPPAF